MADKFPSKRTVPFQESSLLTLAANVVQTVGVSWDYPAKIFYILVQKEPFSGVLPATINLAVDHGGTILETPLDKISVPTSGTVVSYPGFMTTIASDSKWYYFPDGIMMGGATLKLRIGHTAAGQCRIFIFGTRM